MNKLNNLASSENIIKWLPGFLIFFGFYYLYSYLSFFDLQVSILYDWDEILLKFLPVIDIILPITLLYVVLWGMLYFFNNIQGRNSMSFRWTWVHLIFLKSARRHYKRISKRKYVVPLAIFKLFFNTTFVLFLMWILSNEVIKSRNEIDIIDEIFVAIITILFAIELIRVWNSTSPVRIRIPAQFALMTVCLLIFLGFVKSLASFYAQPSMRQKYAISFNYDGKFICPMTDTTHVIQTKNFIVLRSMRDSTNYIFEKSKMSGLKFKKIGNPEARH